MAPVGKLQKAVLKGGTKIVCCWTVEELKRAHCFEEFSFGPGEWYLETNAVSEVMLSGPYDDDGNNAQFKGRISWKLSVLDMEDKSAEGVCRHEDGGLYYCLRFERHPNVSRVNGSLKVLIELRIIADVSSQTEKHPGDPEIAGTLQPDVRCTKNSWILPEFWVLAQKGRRLSSKEFEFGSRLWQLHMSPHTSDVSLSLESADESGAPFPFSWKLSVENDRADVLKRTDGVCQGAEEPLDVTLHLGPLPDVQGFVKSDGALKVQCELRQSDEISDTPSCIETEAGTDILVRDFQRLLTSGESSDATVRVKGERDFRVHRSVLVARTPIFASMFRHQMSESATGIVKVEDCEPDTFEWFLQHIYTGRVVDLCPQNALRLYQVADKYQVDDLKSKCLECVKGGISIQLFCPTLQLALQYSETELTQLATEFFANNMKEIIMTVEWQQFLGENHIVANELFVRALGATSKTCKFCNR